jgi:hypothetical protein
MTRSVRWALEPAAPTPTERVRRFAEYTLRHAGALLAIWARAIRNTEAHASPAAEPVLEFYAEAGAPEGALYVDGQRVGVLEGVTRL